MITKMITKTIIIYNNNNNERSYPGGIKNMKNGNIEDMKKFYAERDGKPVIIPQYERPDGGYPPGWLTRRMNQEIDRRIR